MFRARKAKASPLLDVWQEFVRALEPPYELGAVLTAALDVVAAVFPAMGYYAYAGEPTASLLKLRVTRTSTGIPTVGPNYAGLVSGAPIRQTPLEIPPPADPEECALVGPRAEPFMSLAVGPQVVLRASVPEGRRMSDGERQALQAFASRARPLLEVVLYVDALSRKLETRAIGATTQRRAAELALQGDRVLELVCRLGGEALHASVGGLVSFQGTPGQTLWGTGDAGAFLGAFDAPRLLAGAKAKALVWSAPRIPAGLEAVGVRGLVALSFQGAGLFYGCPEPIPPTDHMKEVLGVLARSVGDTLTSLKAARDGQAYLKTLVSVVDLLDAADPFNSAHSVRVAELSATLAAELALPPEDIEEARLAGRLHDLGMAAISLDLPLTEGALTDAKRRLIQNHPEVGADLVGALPASIVSERVVEAIRYHHERVDGLGYPEGLTGDGIPLLAKIVAGAETFVARTSARSYRRGLSEGRALYEVLRLGGTQLDDSVTAALIRAYHSRGVEPTAPER